LGLRAPLVEQASGEAASQNLQNFPSYREQVAPLLDRACFLTETLVEGFGRSVLGFACVAIGA